MNKQPSPMRPGQSPMLYQRLTANDSIRLLKLHPGTGTAPVVCDLIHIESVKTAPPYECISYVWGDPAVTKSIQCIPCTGTGDEICADYNTTRISLPVTKSLAEALAQLRDSCTWRTLWADAICINQNDVTERAHQVSLMRSIYATCQSVIIWIGPEDQSIIQAEQVMYKLAAEVSTKVCPVRETGARSARAHAEIHSRVHWSSPPMRSLCRRLSAAANIADFADTATVKALSREDLDAIGQLLGRPWFHRVWVIQEVSFCPDINLYCGSYCIPWEIVCLTASCLVKYRDEVRERFHCGSLDPYTNQSTSDAYKASIFNVILMRDRDLQMPQNISLLTLLRRASQFRATDPRDKIYALLGRLPSHLGGEDIEKLQYGIRPDYELNVVQVYTELAARSIEGRGDLAILSYVRPGKERKVPCGRYASADFPSWVPRWDLPMENLIMGEHPELYDSTGVGRGLEPKHARYDVSTIASRSTWRSLTLRSVAVDSVDSIGDTMDYSCYHELFPKFLEQALFLAGSQPMRSINEKSFEVRGDKIAELIRPFAAIARTLTIGMTSGKAGKWTGQSWESHAADFLSYFETYLLSMLSGEYVDSAAHFVAKVAPYLHLPSAGEKESARHFVELLIQLHSGNSDRFYRSLLQSWDYQSYPSDRRFFRTTTGRIGVGPADLCCGDRLYVLRGGHMLYAFRRDSHKSADAFIGECYVDGCMNGEWSHVNWETEGHDKTLS